MAEYRKYMFDDFVVTDRKAEEDPVPAKETLSVTEIALEETAGQAEDEVFLTQSAPEKIEESPAEEPVAEQIIEPSYSKSDMEEAARQAAAEAYQQGKEEALSAEQAKQNALLEEIRSQLSALFSKIDEQEAEREADAVKAALAAVHKIFPTLDKETAAAEIKNFLQDVFPAIAGQASLSFSFHPDSVALVAGVLGKLAEQNDFEGKIAVHKDIGLGLSDCRIEWKDGSVERKAEALLEKIEDLTDDKQEREHG